MIRQAMFSLGARTKGFHIITDEVLGHIGALPSAGLLHLFIQHTSAGLAINEHADPTVRDDLDRGFDRMAPEGPHYMHDDEGPDDMPAHIKSVLAGSSVSVPILKGRLALGTWQGIYLCEFRARASKRKIVATIVSD